MEQPRNCGIRSKSDGKKAAPVSSVSLEVQFCTDDCIRFLPKEMSSAGYGHIRPSYGMWYVASRGMSLSRRTIMSTLRANH